jgi:hypothetical protein
MCRLKPPGQVNDHVAVTHQRIQVVVDDIGGDPDGFLRLPLRLTTCHADDRRDLRFLAKRAYHGTSDVSGGSKDDDSHEVAVPKGGRSKRGGAWITRRYERRPDPSDGVAGG